MAWPCCQADTGVPAFPAEFVVRDVEGAGAALHLRIGGKGDAVVASLHGFGETGDMWAPLAAQLPEHFTVVVPDLRGMGLSARPEGGYDKKTQARQLAAVLDAWGVRSVALVAHDIGNMVGCAFAAQYSRRVSRFAIIDASLPGIEPWTEIARRHAVWHWSFWGRRRRAPRGRPLSRRLAHAPCGAVRPARRDARTAYTSVRFESR